MHFWVKQMISNKLENNTQNNAKLTSGVKGRIGHFYRYVSPLKTNPYLVWCNLFQHNFPLVSFNGPEITQKNIKS